MLILRLPARNQRFCAAVHSGLCIRTTFSEMLWALDGALSANEAQMLCCVLWILWTGALARVLYVFENHLQWVYVMCDLSLSAICKVRRTVLKLYVRILQISDLNVTLTLTRTPTLTIIVTQAKLRSAFCKLRRPTNRAQRTRSDGHFSWFAVVCFSTFVWCDVAPSVLWRTSSVASATLCRSVCLPLASDLSLLYRRTVVGNLSAFPAFLVTAEVIIVL